MPVIPNRIWVVFDGFEDNIRENPVVSPVHEPHRSIARIECIEVIVADERLAKPVAVVIRRPSPIRLSCATAGSPFENVSFEN